MSQSTITVGGVTIYGPALSPDTRDVTPHRLAWDLDEADSAEFSEDRSGPVPSYRIGQAVTWSVPLDDGSGNSAQFRGEIVDVQIGPTDVGYAIGYQALGLKYVCDKIYTTNPTATPTPGAFLFNLPQDDPDYIASLAGMSVGQILAYLLDEHAAALFASGVGTGAAGSCYLAADISALTIVPPSPVLIRGPLMSAIDGLLDAWSPIYSACVQYQSASSTWVVRALNSTTFAAQTVTLGVDPVIPPAIRRDSSHAASRCVVRGLGEISGAYLSLKDGTFFENFPDPTTGAANPTGNATVNSNAIATWNFTAFTQPKGAVDEGSVTALTSTTVTVQSSNAQESYPANYWSSIEATLWLLNPAATDLTFQQQFRITTNTAMTAGGTATIQWDPSLAITSTGYTKYYIVGQPATGLNETWRRYGVPSQLAGKLVKRSPYPLPFAQASLVYQTNYPVAIVYDGNGVGYPATFQLDVPTTQVVFDVPVVQYFNSATVLAAGGTGVTPPADIICFLLYSKGALEAHYPADGAGGAPTYGGTSYAVDGLQRTWTVDVGDAWTYALDTPNMLALAQMLWQSVCNTVVTGEVTYRGKLAWAIAALGNQLSIANGPGLPATGWESLQAPIRAVELEFPGAPEPDSWRTHLKLNNRRRPKTGEAYYVHPRHPDAGPPGSSCMRDIGLAMAGASGGMPDGLLAGMAAGDVATPWGNYNASTAAQGRLDDARNAADGTPPESPPETPWGGGMGGAEMGGLTPEAEPRPTARRRPKPRGAPPAPFRMVRGRSMNLRPTPKPQPKAPIERHHRLRVVPPLPVVHLPRVPIPEPRPDEG